MAVAQMPASEIHQTTQPLKDRRSSATMIFNDPESFSQYENEDDDGDGQQFFWQDVQELRASKSLCKSLRMQRFAAMQQTSWRAQFGGNDSFALHGSVPTDVSVRLAFRKTRFDYDTETSQLSSNVYSVAGPPVAALDCVVLSRG